MFDYKSLKTTRKGGEAYTAADLNRINAALRDLRDRLKAAGYAPALNGNADFDWSVSDWLTPSTAGMLLDNLREIRRQLTVFATTPAVPDSMENLTAQRANDMEQILFDVDRIIRLVEPIKPRCGAYFCGAVIYPSNVPAKKQLSPVLAENSWPDIVQACWDNTVPAEWSVGEEKPMLIGGKNYGVVIIGRNHDTYTDGGTAPLTFQLRDSLDTRYMVAPNHEFYSTFADTPLAKNTLPAIEKAMPEEVRSAIRPVTKNLGTWSGVVEPFSLRLFLPSEVEITGRNDFSYAGEGVRYDYYKGLTALRKTSAGVPFRWLTSSFYIGGGMVYVNERGKAEGAKFRIVDTLPMGVSPAFCF